MRPGGVHESEEAVLKMGFARDDRGRRLNPLELPPEARFGQPSAKSAHASSSDTYLARKHVATEPSRR